MFENLTDNALEYSLGFNKTGQLINNKKGSMELISLRGNFVKKKAKCFLAHNYKQI